MADVSKNVKKAVDKTAEAAKNATDKTADASEKPLGRLAKPLRTRARS